MSRKDHTLTRAISVDGLFSNPDDRDDELVNQLHQLASKLDQESWSRYHRLPVASSRIHRGQDPASSLFPAPQRPWPVIWRDPPELPDLFPASVGRNANSNDLPLSLRMIKRRKKTLSPEATAVETPVKKAFSSMVFIIGELQRCTLQMRGLLFVENLDGIQARVHQEMHASFVWLFQQIFSCTPTLMLSLMLILANFTLNSMPVSAAAPPAAVMTATVEEWRSDVGISSSSSSYHGRAISAPDQDEEEGRLWSMMVHEASRMQAALRDDALMDTEILQRLVSPVTVDPEPENEGEYLQTELMYHQVIAQDPGNGLLLCNFAQFLYLVLRDLDRAEYYFKRAVEAEPEDVEALGRYAGFLWQGRNELDAAERTYLKAIAVDPSSSFHAGNYAHFLWSTGGEDACYLLD